MPEFSFKAAKYDVLSMTMGGSNLGDISLIDIHGEPVDGHGVINHKLLLFTAPWVKLPANGTLNNTRRGAVNTYDIRKGCSRAYYDHIYLMLLNEDPVTVEVGHSGDDILPFNASAPSEIEEEVSHVRFRVGGEPVGEIEDIRAFVEKLT